MEMDPDFNTKLIKYVKRYECLYDVTSPEYRNNTFKKTIWSKISENLNTKEAVCKKRWKSLRDTYKRGVRYDGMTTCSLRPLPKKTYKFAAALSFLGDIKEGRQICSSDDDDAEINDDNEPSWPALPSPEDTQMDEFTKEEESVSSFCLPSDHTSPIKKTEENVKPAFTEVLAKCSADNDETRPSDPLAVRNSTLLLFESLAHKIMAAGLSESDVDAIELKVASVVYEEISNRRQRKQSKVK